jgi:hypothetical protein
MAGVLARNAQQCPTVQTSVTPGRCDAAGDFKPDDAGGSGAEGKAHAALRTLRRLAMEGRWSALQAAVEDVAPGLWQAKPDLLFQLHLCRHGVHSQALLAWRAAAGCHALS